MRQRTSRVGEIGVQYCPVCKPERDTAYLKVVFHITIFFIKIDKRHGKYYLWVVIGMFEPEFPVSRIAFTKLCTIMTILDYFYHAHGSLDDLKLFAEGVKR